MSLRDGDMAAVFSMLSGNKKSIDKNKLIAKIRELYGYKKPSNQLINDLIQLEEDEIDFKYRSD
jgi:hypothetical protein